MGQFKQAAIEIEDLVTEALNSIYKELDDLSYVGYEGMLHCVTKAAADYVSICFDEARHENQER